MDEKFPKKTSTDESKGEMLMDCNHMNQATNWGGVGVYVLKSSKIPSEIRVHCHCKLGIYSFSKHGKHLRN